MLTVTFQRDKCKSVIVIVNSFFRDNGNSDLAD